MSTETPETDAKWNLETNKGHFHDWRSVAFEMRDQSRSLERRNSDITVRIAEMERNLAHEQQQSAKIDACLNTQLETITARNTQIDRMRLELAEARKDSAWQPIETAPKDEEVLVWGAAGPMMAIWFTDAGRWLCTWDHSDINAPILWKSVTPPATPLPEKEGTV